ncbi:MAG: hypothetical protein ABFD60_01600 [Bryobacteraceae bacterium]
MAYEVKVDGLTYPPRIEDAEYLRRAGGLSEEARVAALRAVAERGGFVTRAAGDVVEDIPSFSVPWLLEQGIIVEISDKERVHGDVHIG